MTKRSRASRSTSKISPTRDICKRAMQSVLGSRADDAEWIKDRFSYLLTHVLDEAYDIYLREQHPAAMSNLKALLTPYLPEEATADDVLRVMDDNFRLLDEFFLSLGQSRKSRAGKTFEYVMRDFFTALDYPHACQPVIDGKPDFLFPSNEHFGNNAMDCIIFTLKRTLKERWRQITTEGTHGLGFYLATIDVDVPKKGLAEMASNRITLVVPSQVKRDEYSEAHNVMSFEHFFEHKLDPAMANWRATGVIR